MSIKPVEDIVYRHLGDMVRDISINQLQFRDHSDRLRDQLHHIDQDLTVFQNILTSLEKSIDSMIDEIQPRYFVASYDLYDKEMCHETAEYILNRKLNNITPEGYDFIKTRASIYSDWKYPAVLIRPSNEEFLETLVGCDPLYLVDQSHDLLWPSKKKFNEKYQSRLRYLTITESIDRPMLASLPDAQIGFFFAYNFFNFRPLEMFEKYLSEIYQKLRPGGVLGMTFNNCDFPEGAGFCENSFMCYTPGSMIERLAEKIGYEVQFQYITHHPNTWIEFRKPGEITSLRGGQSLAKVVVKSK